MEWSCVGDTGVIFCRWPYEDLTFLPQLSPLVLPESVSSVILHSSSPSPTRLIAVSHTVLWFYFLDIIFLEFTSRPKSLRWAIAVSSNCLSFFLFLPPDLTTVEVVTSLTPLAALLHIQYTLPGIDLHLQAPLLPIQAFFPHHLLLLLPHMFTSGCLVLSRCGLHIFS